MRGRVTGFCLALALAVPGGPAFGREAKEQRARRDLAARSLLIALDDLDAGGITAASTALAANLEPEGVPVFAPLRQKLAAFAAILPVDAKAKAGSLARALILESATMFGVDAAPALTSDLDAARAVYKEHCRSCHGDAGAGDGVLAAKVKGGVPSFVSGPSAAKSPFGFYQKIAGGKPGTPMPGYDKKFEPPVIWGLAYLCAAFDAKPPVVEADAAALLKRGLSLEVLSRSDDAELSSWSADPALVPYLRLKAPFLRSIPRSSHP